MEWSEIADRCRYYEDNTVEVDARITDAMSIADRLELQLDNGYRVRISRSEFPLIGNHLKLSGTIGDFRDDVEFIASAIRRKIETNRRRYASKFIILRPEMRIIGLKTTRYQRLTNHTVIRAAERLMSEYGLSFVGKRSFINERIMVLSFVTDSSFGTRTGDYRTGITVINSETGYAPLAVKHYLDRVQCSNGMVVNVGYGESVATHVYTDLYDRLNSMISETINDDTVLRRILRAEEREIEPARIDELLGIYGIKKKYREMIASVIELDNGTCSVMDLYNAVTYVANHYLVSAEAFSLLSDASRILG